VAIPAINYYYANGALVPSGGVMSYHISSTPTYIPPSPYGYFPSYMSPVRPSEPYPPWPPSTVPPAPPPVKSPSPIEQKESAFVTITDEAFSPNTLIIGRGAMVRWINAGKEKHTITSERGLWDSGQIDPSAAYTITFTRSGTYQYHCNNHRGMTGTIVVQE
jgi:plastocyanin